jgi:hypothetical protein
MLLARPRDAAASGATVASDAVANAASGAPPSVSRDEMWRFVCRALLQANMGAARIKQFQQPSRKASSNLFHALGAKRKTKRAHAGASFTAAVRERAKRTVDVAATARMLLARPRDAAASGATVASDAVANAASGAPPSVSRDELWRFVCRALLQMNTSAARIKELQQPSRKASSNLFHALGAKRGRRSHSRKRHKPAAQRAKTSKRTRRRPVAERASDFRGSSRKRARDEGSLGGAAAPARRNPPRGSAERRSYVNTVFDEEEDEEEEEAAAAAAAAAEDGGDDGVAPLYRCACDCSSWDGATGMIECTVCHGWSHPSCGHTLYSCDDGSPKPRFPGAREAFKCQLCTAGAAM